MKRYTVGVDFGTLSARAVLLDVKKGETLASAVMEYPHGVMDRTLPDGTELPPQSALQHPQDYVDALGTVIREVLQKAGISPEEVSGLGIDFTSCTLVALDQNREPLCLDPRFASRPQSYVKLWKHHASQWETEKMTEIAVERGEKWISYCGGKLSPEWAFPKIYETLRRDEEVYRATHCFCEAGEWLTSRLTGEDVHAAAFAGFKFNWTREDGFPSNDYFCAVDPRLDGIIGTKISTNVRSVEQTAGCLTAKGAAMTGLCEGTPVALPMLDAEAAMPALNVTEAERGLLVLGTSGVLLLHDPAVKQIDGICGLVQDGVIPGLCTYEAGQAGFGDCFEWFVRTSVPASYVEAAQKEGKNIHVYLRERAQKLRIGEHGLLALDWFNGNRSVLQDADLTGMILGMHIGTRPEEIYRALIEATAFGMRRILETYRENGIVPRQLGAAGGIANKDDMLMQIYADVLDREICVFDTAQAGALGSAIYAAVAGGLYRSVIEAAKVLSVKPVRTYVPIPAHTKAYDVLYAEYCRLYDYFGRGENPVMKTLRKIAQSGGCE
ncbi:MAG: ribulokinase [Ruminococcaceae bacterium]|nr:ribulokinase [Oscillospiraceae bacterium]